MSADMQQEISKLSHEAKNVVCNIMGAVEIIEMEDVTKDAVLLEMLSHIKESADTLMGVIAKIVDRARQNHTPHPPAA
jgi:2-methylaconitate cis-trans-isomerase PrpF